MVGMSGWLIPLRTSCQGGGRLLLHGMAGILHQHAIGGGSDARAATYLQLRIGDTPTLFGVGIDHNVLTASLKAVVSGLLRSGVALARPRPQPLRQPDATA